MTHNEMANHLAECRHFVDTKKYSGASRLTFTNIPYDTTMYFDVVELHMSLVKPLLVIYEVKVSRADFFSDVKKGKYLKYLPHCNQLYFACESGMVSREEVPDDCGLIVLKNGSWSVVKKAKTRTYKADWLMSMRLIMARKDLPDTIRDLKIRTKYKENYSLKDHALELGREISKEIKRTHSVEKELKIKLAQVKQDLLTIKEVRKKIITIINSISDENLDVNYSSIDDVNYLLDKIKNKNKEEILNKLKDTFLAEIDDLSERIKKIKEKMS